MSKTSRPCYLMQHVSLISRVIVLSVFFILKVFVFTTNVEDRVGKVMNRHR